MLSRSRFMFIAQFTERFPQRLCAELRGHFDENGESPFWNAVGSHFYQIDFNEADYLSSHGKKSFVAELMPRYPVYLDCCPIPRNRRSASRRDTAPARKMLEAEGLRYENHVDISMPARCSNAMSRTCARCARACWRRCGSANARNTDSDAKSLVSNTLLEDFRCGATTGAVEDGAFLLSADEAAALRVKEGDIVRVLTSYPRARSKIESRGQNMDISNQLYIGGDLGRRQGRGVRIA